jgi:adenylate kinase
VAGISDLPSGFGPAAKTKFLLLGSSDPQSILMNQVRSLNLEHVSPAPLKGPEISRRAASAVADEAYLLTLMRRWFFARKPDAGFVLSHFPATLLQAKVFDEWLDARDEALTAVLALPGATTATSSNTIKRSASFTRRALSPLRDDSHQKQGRGRPDARGVCYRRHGT